MKQAGTGFDQFIFYLKQKGRGFRGFRVRSELFVAGGFGQPAIRLFCDGFLPEMAGFFLRGEAGAYFKKVIEIFFLLFL